MLKTICLNQIPFIKSIFKIALFLLLTNKAYCEISEVRFIGLKRTNIEWLKDYLELKSPPFAKPSATELFKLRLKLENSGAFVSAKVKIDEKNDNTLIIEVDEKWTTIPVARAAFGGGTPLKVLGIYDIHGFGRLHTYGIEARTYGNADTGGVIWFRAPRWLDGYHTLGLELWQDNRIRDIYDNNRNIQGQYYSNELKLRGLYEKPFSQSKHHKIGLDLKAKRQQEQLFEPNEKASLNFKTYIEPVEESSETYDLSLRYVFDNVHAHHLQMIGTRFISLLGTSNSSKNNFTSKLEAEIFHYSLINSHNYLATHVKANYSDSLIYSNLVFLGGFESVRGYPDGITYGNKTIYTNLELRNRTYESSLIHLQGVIFSDIGYSSLEAEQPRHSAISSIGFGIRASYPKIHRLVIRLDIAKPLEKEGNFGISFGMNQLFQPYKPL